ncbi:MAG: DNA polymerase IV [Desulfobacteraceae bacterium]|nr:DNA polymerase IV [Desulfobacteraceae bacterium]
MDAFFASVEQLDNPALKGQSLVVGGLSGRGVVAAASYEARRYGIHSAMPIFQARQRCADLVIVPPRRKRYAQLSRRIMDRLSNFSPLVEPVSIDEAYLDASGCGRLFGTGRQMAMMIKQQIFEDVRLSCSVGVAPNKFLAKIASDFNKPDGLTVIEPDQVLSFIDELEVGKVPGVGTRTREQLSKLGVHTLGNVRGLSTDLLVRKLGKFGYRLMSLAHGQDDSPVTPDSPAKSFSSEITLDQDTRDRFLLENYLLAQAQSVGRQLRLHGKNARTITLKLKTSDFRSHTRSRTLNRAVNANEAVFQAARELLNRFVINLPVRLVGIGATSLQDEHAPAQADLFDETDGNRFHKWENLDRAVDAISERFGGRSVTRGSLTVSAKLRK